MHIVTAYHNRRSKVGRSVIDISRWMIRFLVDLTSLERHPAWRAVSHLVQHGEAECLVHQPKHYLRIRDRKTALSVSNFGLRSLAQPTYAKKHLDQDPGLLSCQRGVIPTPLYLGARCGATHHFARSVCSSGQEYESRQKAYFGDVIS